jgi:hypothetical protein
MTIDMTNNRVPYGLLTDEEKAALHDHEKAGGKFEYWTGVMWYGAQPHPTLTRRIYRTVPLPAQHSEQSSLKTQDVIAWDRLPDWAQWVARDEGGDVWAYDEEPECSDDEYRGCGWMFESSGLRIDDWPGIVQIGTADWRESKQRRPRG